MPQLVHRIAGFQWLEMLKFWVEQKPWNLPFVGNSIRNSCNGRFSSKQLADDGKPLRFQCLTASGFSSPTIPIRSVALVAFLAMEVGVDPGTFDAFVLLGRLVCPGPVALSVPPESQERKCEPDRR